MKSFIPLLCALALLLPACGEPEPDPAPEFPEIAVNEPEDRTAAVAGTVRFEGEAPRRRKLPPPDAACRHEGDILDETLVVGADGGLQNVLVWIEKGAEAWTFEHDRSEVLVDQLGCVFIPHVVAVRTFQPIRFKNSDPLHHNVNCSNGKEGFARNVTPRQQSFVSQFKETELGKKVVCDLHANMLMYIHVLEHPWFSVTGADGAFEIPDLAPGDYTLAARHERLGTQRVDFSVASGGRATAGFTFRLP